MAVLGRDEVDVEELLVWVYRDQKAHRAEDMGLSQQDVWEGGLIGGGCALGAGERVDTSVRSFARLHADAEAVHDVVRALPRLTCGLIIEHAKVGGRPDWWPGCRVEVRDILRRGKPVRLYDDNRNPVGVKRGPVVVRDLDGGGAELVTALSAPGLDMARMLWREWWAGLVAVKAGLRGVKLSVRVVGPAAEVEPWTGYPREGGNKAA